MVDELSLLKNSLQTLGTVVVVVCFVFFSEKKTRKKLHHQFPIIASCI